MKLKKEASTSGILPITPSLGHKVNFISLKVSFKLELLNKLVLLQIGSLLVPIASKHALKDKGVLNLLWYSFYLIQYFQIMSSSAG